MRIVFGGGEVPSHRLLLIQEGVRNIGLSVGRLVKRGMPKTKPYDVEAKFGRGVVWLDGGASSVSDSPEQDVLALADVYDSFVVENINVVAYVIEFDHPLLGKRIESRRSDFYDALPPEKFVPVWDGQDDRELARLCEKYPNVAIPGSVVESHTNLASRANPLVSRYGTSLHALGVAKPDNLRSILFESASTLAWTSPMRRGEIIAWDGSSLVRYQKKMKERARPRLVSVAAREGLDPDLILAGNPSETTRLAIRGYLKLEEQMDKQRPSRPFQVLENGSEPDQSDSPKPPAFSDGGPGDADHCLPLPGGAAPKEAAVRHPSGRRTLPVFDVSQMTVTDTSDGGTTIRDVSVLRSKGSSLRQCSTCFVSSTCPAFEPGSECAFDLPVEVKTREQLRALLNSIIEMQAHRVAFARYAEELNGGYPDPNTSLEIDRLFKITKALKELEQSNEFVRMTVERQTAGGVLSAIFGEKAQVLSNLPEPIDPSKVIVQQLEQ